MRVPGGEESRAAVLLQARCRLIDLGRWLDEKQGLPIEPEEREEAAGGGSSTTDS